MKLEVTAQSSVKRAGPGRTLLAFIILLNFWLEKGHSTLQRSVLRAGKHGGPTPELKTTQHCVRTALGLRYRAYWFEGCGTRLPALHWICSLIPPGAVWVPSPVLCLPRVLLNLSLVKVRWNLSTLLLKLVKAVALIAVLPVVPRPAWCPHPSGHAQCPRGSSWPVTNSCSAVCVSPLLQGQTHAGGTMTQLGTTAGLSHVSLVWQSQASPRVVHWRNSMRLSPATPWSGSKLPFTYFKWACYMPSCIFISYL